jgi:hypothetical protein
LFIPGACAALWWMGGRRRWVTFVAAWVVVGGLVGWMWRRSWGSYDDLLWARGGSEHELSSHAGAVRWLRVDDGAAQRPVEWASASGPESELPAHHKSLKATVSRTWWGLGLERGVTPVDRNGRQPAFLLVSVPYWSLAALAGTPLMVWTAGCGVGAMRRRLRRRRGLCAACGYDLRGGGGERCPECGA